MDIELKLLRSFAAIYERGSISRAADQLRCTQAAMSMRLKMLEQELGGQLFQRMHHHLEPTALGSEFYAKALTLLSTYDELISKTRSRTHIQKVRIGMPDDYALGIFSNVIAKIRKDINEFDLEIVCDLSANLVAGLQRQDIDIVLATLAAPPSSARFMIEAKLNWVSHPDYRRTVGSPVALSAYPEGCVFRKAMITSLDSNSIPWRVASQSKSRSGVIAAVRAAAAITVMAEGTAPADLLARPESHGLPRLDPIPIYMLRGSSPGNDAMTKIETAIRYQLEADYAMGREFLPAKRE